MTRLDVGSEAIVIGSKWSYLYITSMTNTGTNIATDSKTIGRKILISIWREKLNEFYKSTRYHSYWILFEYMFSKVWGLRINLILLPRSAKKENLFLCTGKFFFN